MKKNKVSVILDSSAGDNWKEVENSHLIPLIIMEKSDKELIEYKDLVTIKTEEVYEKIKDKKNISTSQMIMGEAMSLAEELIKNNDYVFVFSISKGLSGSMNTWNQIKDALDTEKLVIFDTCDVTHGMTILAQEVLNEFKKGKSIDELHDFVANWNKRRRGELIVNDLDCLIKGGRISSFKGTIAKMLKLKICISFQNDLNFVDKSSSLEKIIDIAMSDIDKKINFSEKGIDKIFFGKTLCRDGGEEYEKFKKGVQDWINKKGIDFNITCSDKNMPSIISVHTGIDAFYVYVVAKQQ